MEFMDYVYIILGIVALIVIWHLFLRNRCPQCNSTNVNLINKEELDRWLGKKQVTEKLASGKTKTRYVQVTFVKNRYTYKCEDCGHIWSETKEEEK